MDVPQFYVMPSYYNRFKLDSLTEIRLRSVTGSDYTIISLPYSCINNMVKWV